MFRKNKKRKSHRFYIRKEKKKSSKFLEASIVFLTLLLLIYSFSFLKKISQSETTLGSSPNGESIFIRTQVLNGCQQKDLAQRMADRLKELKVGNITYDVIQVGNFESSETEQSLILDRTVKEKDGKPSQIALLTAQALGIDKENVLCKELRNNYQEIVLTIVMGKDHQKLFETKR